MPYSATQFMEDNSQDLTRQEAMKNYAFALEQKELLHKKLTEKGVDGLSFAEMVLYFAAAKKEKDAENLLAKVFVDEKNI